MPPAPFGERGPCTGYGAWPLDPSTDCGLKSRAGLGRAAAHREQVGTCPCHTAGDSPRFPGLRGFFKGSGSVRCLIIALMVSGCQRRTAWCDQQEELCFLLKSLVCMEEGRFRLKAKILYCEGGEAPSQVAWRNCGCPIPGSVRGQAGWDIGQPDLLAGVPLPMEGEGCNQTVFEVTSNPNV